MMKNITQVSPNSCCGCGACEAVCPTTAIKLKPDAEGFLAPVVSEDLCINCSKCLCSCPIESVSILAEPKQAYIYRSLLHESDASSSGGAAYALGRAIIRRGGAVVACVFQEDGIARHVAVNSMEKLNAIQGSKYVQSDSRKGYLEVASLLKQATEVLYIGTPCQVAAVKRLFPNESKLITCDIVCHGVPSPRFWSQELEYQNSRGFLLDRNSVMFRSSDSRSTANYELYCKGSNSKKKLNWDQSLYFKAFLNNSSLRNSCYACPYAQEKRVGDLTIGDSASRDCYPKFHPCDSVSSVIINTDCGAALFNQICVNGEADYQEIDYLIESRMNKQLHAPSVRPAARDEVYKELAKVGYESVRNKYVKRRSVGQAAKELAKILIPLRARVALQQVVRSFKNNGR